MAQLPRVDGFLRERLPDGQIAYARLHAPPLQTLPSPFELVPISPLLTREELERDYLPGCQDEPQVRLMVPMERIRELLALTNGGPRFALNIYFYFFQRYFWAARDRVRVRRADAPLRPCAPARLAVVYDDDYAFDEGAHPDTSVLDLMWQQMQRHQFFGLPEAAVRQFLFNLVRCSVVMLGSRGFKGVEVQGQLEAHNDAVRQHQDGRLYTREFRVLTARTRADSIMRPRVLPVGPVPKTITRRCPSYYTHTWWQHEPLWRPQPVPPLTQTQAHWRKLYQFACDLAPFLGTSDRTTLARALDRQCPRGTPFHGSLNRSAKVFDPELFPQTQARVGGLERLRLCHFVADGGLAVCPPLHALLEDDACDADDSELWNPPLPTLRARAAAASASAVDDEPASHRTRVAAPAIAASAATGARATDPLHAVKQRVMFDLELGHGLSNETAYQILQHAPEPVNFLQHVAGDRINTLLQRALPAGHNEFYLAKLQDLFRQGQAVGGASWAPHPVLQRFVTTTKAPPASFSSLATAKRKKKKREPPRLLDQPKQSKTRTATSAASPLVPKVEFVKVEEEEIERLHAAPWSPL